MPDPFANFPKPTPSTFSRLFDWIRANRPADGWASLPRADDGECQCPLCDLEAIRGELHVARMALFDALELIEKLKQQGESNVR